MPEVEYRAEHGPVDGREPRHPGGEADAVGETRAPGHRLDDPLVFPIAAMTWSAPRSRQNGPPAAQPEERDGEARSHSFLKYRAIGSIRNPEDS